MGREVAKLIRGVLIDTSPSFLECSHLTSLSFDIVKTKKLILAYRIN